MRRSYEFKQESYIVQERGSWSPPSYKDNHVSNMLGQSSFDHYEPSDDHHNDMVFSESPRIVYHGDGSRGWCGTCHVNHSTDYHVKKNEHHAMGTKTILRPPLGLVNLPSHQHRNKATFDEEQALANHNGWRYGGSYERFGSALANHNRHVEGYRKLDEKPSFEGHHDKGRRLDEELETLIKGLHALPARVGMVKKVEIIEYERRSYSPGGLVSQQEWKVLGGKGPSNTINRFTSGYPKNTPWVKGF